MAFSYLAYRFPAFICRLKGSSLSSEMHRTAFMSARIAVAHVCNCQTETACCPQHGLAPVRRHEHAPVTVVPFSTFWFIHVCLDRGRHGSDAQSSGNTQVVMGNGVGFGECPRIETASLEYRTGCKPLPWPGPQRFASAWCDRDFLTPPDPAPVPPKRAVFG